MRIARVLERVPGERVWADFRIPKRVVVFFIMGFTAFVSYVQCNLIVYEGVFGKRYLWRLHYVMPDLTGTKSGKTIRRYLGLHGHPVFMDYHFRNYNHVVGVKYVPENGPSEWLPITTEEGQPSWYCTGRQWVAWTFRVSSSRVNAERLNDGLPRFTAFWLGKNNLERNGAR